MKAIQVAITDDHRLFREGLAFMIDRMDDIEMLFETEDGEQLLNKLQTVIPDILLLDLDMPDFNGIEVFKRIKPIYRDLRVIILSTHTDPKMVAYLMELGANSYIFKDTEPHLLEKAIKAVYAEGYYFTKEVSEAMLMGLKGHTRKVPRLKGGESLSDREIEVLSLLAQGDNAKEIAEKLFISDRTVEGHRRRMIEKLGVKNTAGLVAKAIREGFL